MHSFMDEKQQLIEKKTQNHVDFCEKVGIIVVGRHMPC